jgi:hypothetical protein
MKNVCAKNDCELETIGTLLGLVGTTIKSPCHVATGADESMQNPSNGEMKILLPCIASNDP